MSRSPVGGPAPVTLTELEAAVFRRVVAGTDPWAGTGRWVGSRRCSQALGRLQRKGLINYQTTDEGEAAHVLTEAGYAFLDSLVLPEPPTDGRTGSEGDDK